MLKYIILALGTASAVKVIEYSPETKDNLKHKLRHILNWNVGGDIVNYQTTEGKRKTGLRCRICEEILGKDNEDKSLIKEDEGERQVRKHHQDWYARWGTKNNNAYLGWLISTGRCDVKLNNKY